MDETQMPRVPDARGLSALILGASLLGFAAMLVRWSAPAGPLAIGFYRMAIALPLVAWMAWKARRTGRPEAGRARLWSGVAGLCFVADLWMWHSALHHTSAANATPITRRRMALSGWKGSPLGSSGTSRVPARGSCAGAEPPTESRGGCVIGTGTSRSRVSNGDSDCNGRVTPGNCRRMRSLHNRNLSISGL